MKLEPAKNIIICERRKPVKTKSPGGIVIPDSVRQPNSDKVVDVVDVGTEVEGVEVGDIVVISPYNIVVAVVEGRELAFATIENVLAKLS